jgi:hypothetical protein
MTFQETKQEEIEDLKQHAKEYISWRAGREEVSERDLPHSSTRIT